MEENVEGLEQLSVLFSLMTYSFIHSVEFLLNLEMICRTVQMPSDWNFLVFISQALEI